MATETKIEWCDHTFNPWRGCTKVSAGCANCYAETMSKRNPKVLGIWGDGGTRVVASEAMWREPLKWNAAAKADGVCRRVFCASLADVCEDRHDLIEPRIRLKRLIEATPHLDWLLLTKRPEQYLRLFWGPEWWPSNVWAGTSVENQAAADERISHLLKVPAAVRFLSCEPLLGAINLSGRGWFWDTDITPDAVCGERQIHWVIVGGESGPKARPSGIDWIRDVVVQCKAAAVPCFVKQLGSWIDMSFDDWNMLTDGGLSGSSKFTLLFEGADRGYWRPHHPKGGDPAEWPEDLRVREFPR